MSLQSAESLLWGATAGSLSAVLLQPLDVVKTRMQTFVASTDIHLTADLSHQSTSMNRKFIFNSTFNNPLINSKIRQPSMIKTAKIILKEEGIQALYRGTLPTIFRNAPGAAIYFTILNSLRNSSFVPLTQNIKPNTRTPHDKTIVFHEKSNFHKGMHQTLPELLIGAFARATAGMAVLPMTVIKVRMEAGKFHQNIIKECIKMYKDGGIGSFYRGAVPTALRDAPYAGIHLASYSWLKSILSIDSKCDSKHVNSVSGRGKRTFAAGCAGLIATAVTHPFDVLKTRIQAPTSSTNTKPKLSSVLSNLLTRDGGLTFFRGITPRLVRKGLSSAVTWTVFEELSGMFQRAI